MKKCIIRIGMTLVMVHALPAHAALSPTCAQALVSLPAVSSHYVQRILDRATEGMTYAMSESSHMDFKKYLPNWVHSIETAMLTLIDTDVRLVQTQRDLLENTACLRIDIFLIECKMDEVRATLHQALVEKRTGSILRLESLLNFLNQRLTFLINGARDPSFRDTSWHQSFIFDNPSGPYVFAPTGDPTIPPTCGNGTVDLGEECDQSIGCTLQCQTEMCPFHTDYLPPTVIGFGCDIDVLTSRTGHSPTAQEFSALSNLITQISTYLSQAQIIFTLQQDIDSLLGNTSSLPPSAQPRQHRTGGGCLRDVCAFNRLIPCTDDQECLSQGFGRCMSGLQIGACQLNTTPSSCISDNECGSGDRCITMEDAVWWELRGPFSIQKDEPRILNAFREQREQDGEGRAFPDSFKLPQEFSPSQSPLAATRASNEGPSALLRTLARPVLQVFSRIQEQNESTIFPVGSDPVLEIRNALMPLQQAIGVFAQLTSDRSNSMREFVLAFAYFIRRTCVYQPCNMLTEKIMRIALADECFPYTNGSFLRDSCENPRAAKCITAAGLNKDMRFALPQNSCN